MTMNEPTPAQIGEAINRMKSIYRQWLDERIASSGLRQEATDGDDEPEA